MILSEERPDWRDSSQRMRTPFATLRFVRTSRLWTLSRQCADLRRHRSCQSPLTMRNGAAGRAMPGTNGRDVALGVP